MKSLLPAILIAAAAAVFSSQPNQAARPAPALEATPVVAAAFPAPSPACDCERCDCLAPCKCEPLTVGRPPADRDIELRRDVPALAILSNQVHGAGGRQREHHWFCRRQQGIERHAERVKAGGRDAERPLQLRTELQCL